MLTVQPSAHKWLSYVHNTIALHVVKSVPTPTRCTKLRLFPALIIVPVYHYHQPTPNNHRFKCLYREAGTHVLSIKVYANNLVISADHKQIRVI